jgi:hypothetical protein
MGKTSKEVRDMKYLVWLALLALAFSAGCGGKSALSTVSQPVTLAYKQVGDQYSQYKMSSSVTVNMQGTTTSSVSDITYSARIESLATDGMIVRRLVFDAFSIFEQSGGRLEPDAAAAGYKGQYLWLKLGPQGEVVEWKGLDGIRSFTAEDRDLKNVLVQQMASTFQPLPSEAVNVGSTWHRSIEIPVNIRGGEFKQKIATDYEVIGFGQRSGRNCAKVQTKALLQGEGSGSRGGDRQFWLKSDGAGKGSIWFDYENGLLVEYEMKVTANQTLSYERAGKTDVATEAMTVDSQNQIKLVK